MRAFFCVLVLLAAATASASSVHLSGDSKGLYHQLYKLSSKSIKGLDRKDEILQIGSTSGKGLHIDADVLYQLQKAQDQQRFGTIKIIDLTEYESALFSVVVSNMTISLGARLRREIRGIFHLNLPFFETATEKLVFEGPKLLTILCNRKYFSLANKVILGDSVETLTVNVGVKSDLAHFFEHYENLNTYRLEGSLEAKRVERSEQIVVEFSGEPMSEGNWKSLRMKYPTLQFTVKAAACSGPTRDESLGNASQEPRATPYNYFVASTLESDQGSEASGRCECVMRWIRRLLDSSGRGARSFIQKIKHSGSGAG